MCETELEEKYRNLVQGKTILESGLHANLSEHLNSEVALGTITDLASAKTWLRGSFLFQRIQQNPKFYALGKEDNQTWEERVDEMVMQSINKLQETQLVDYDATEGRAGGLASTEFGDIMSKVTSSKYLIASIFSSMIVLHSSNYGMCICINFIYLRTLNSSQMALILALPNKTTLREIVMVQ